MLFVVHSEGDAAEAEAICGRLEAAGASTWTPTRDFDPALEREAAIRNVLDHCDALLLVSDQGHASADAIAAVDMAASMKKACYLSVPSGSGADAQLMQRQWARIFDASSEELGAFVATLGKDPSNIWTTEERQDQGAWIAPPMVSNYVRPTEEENARFAMHGPALDRFKGLEAPAAWAIGVVASGTAFGALEASMGLRQVLTLGEGGPGALSNFATLSDAFTLPLLFNLVLLILGAVAVLIWMARSIKNLAALGVMDYPFKTAFAVGSFFIPFANLYIPYKAMASLARGSKAPPDPSDPSSWKQNSAPLAVIVWTIFWFSTNIISGVQGRASLAVNGSASDKAWAGAYLSLADGVCVTIAGVALCVLIAQITRWHRNRFKDLTREGQTEAVSAGRSSTAVLGFVIGGLLLLVTLAFGIPKVTMDPVKAEQWFFQAVPGTSFSALLPESVQPDVDHEAAATVNNWTASRGTDAFSIVDYQLIGGADASDDPETAKDVVESLGEELGSTKPEASEVSLGALKGYQMEAPVDKPLVPPGSKAYLRGFAAKGHVVVFMCILTEGELSIPFKEKFFASIKGGSSGTSPGG